MALYALGDAGPAVDPTAYVHPDAVVIGDVHLEGCTIEDGALVGSGAVVLHGAVVRSGSLVVADAVDPDRMIRPGMVSYVQRGAQYREDLRRLE